MDTDEIIVHGVQRNGVCMVLDLLRVVDGSIRVAL
jgi:hypothetical protein